MKRISRRLRLELLEDRTVPSAPGDIDWVRQFGSAFPVAARGRAVDAAGNIYLAGYLSGALPNQTSTGGEDGFVRKLDAAGNEVWTRQFGTSADDEVYRVVGDGSGIYIVGQTGGTLPSQVSAGGTSDAFVRKYDLNGNELWTRQFGSNIDDAALDVAVDSAGAYVVGRIGSGSGDAFVRKYDAGGTLLWNRVYGSASTDSANAVAVDNSGLDVAGFFGGNVPPQIVQGGYLRRYDVNGNEIWTRQGFSPAAVEAMAVDATGIYVAGSTNGTSSDAFVRKFDLAGTVLWTHVFGATIPSGTTIADFAHDIAVDASGVYVAGESNGFLNGFTDGTGAFLRKYDAAGNELWTRHFGVTSPTLAGGGSAARGVAVDASGIYVVGDTNSPFPGQTGSGGADVFVRKYDTAGIAAWTREFGSGGLPATDLARAVDADGNVYVAGDFGASGHFVRKYDAAGNLVWTGRFNAFPTINSIAVDATGVYVAGTVFANATSSQDVFVGKLDTAGRQVWISISGVAGTDSGLAIVVDGANLYVAGLTNGTLTGQPSAGGQDAFARKYDTAGNFVWTRQFGSPGADQASGVAVSAGNVYVTGSTDSALPGLTNAGGQDAFVRMYDGGGGEIWTRQFGTSASDSAADVAADSMGVYVAGSTFGAMSAGGGSAGGQDAFLRKFDTSGGELWTRQFGTADSDQAIGLALGPAGAYVAGITSGTLPGRTSTGGQDAFVRRFDAGGATIWTGQFGTAGTDSVAGMAIGAAGLFVAGSTNGTFPGQVSLGLSDVFVAKIVDAAPNTPLSNLVLTPSASAIDENGMLTVNGSFTDPDVADTHTVVITWGLGEGTTTVNLAAGVTTFGASHPYLDDNPTGTTSDVYPITATVTEPAGGSAGGSTSVRVNNVAPAVTGLLVTPNPVAENDTVTLTGSFTDPGMQDTHTVVISWGPGEGTTTLTLVAGVLTFPASHQYLDDNPGGTATDLYPIGVTVTDDDTGSGSGATAVTVNNVAPTITSLSQSATAITEGGSVKISGTFADPGTLDSYTVTVSWGPGEGGNSVNVAAGATKVFSFTHTYPDDNPTGTSADDYPITVTVSDDDTGSVSGTGTVTVGNAAPVVTIGNPAPGSVITVGTPIAFSGAFTDAGAADTHTAQWLFGAATGTGTVIETGGSGTVSDSYTFNSPGTYSVKLTVTDDGGGTSSDQIQVTIVRRPTSTSLSSPANPSVFGQSAPFTAKVGDAGGGSTVPTGTVQFHVEGIDFGSPVPLVNGAASISTAGLPAGPHTITAVYSGDGDFAASTSDVLIQTVIPATTATVVSASAPTPLFGVDGLTISAVVSVLAPGSGNPTGTVAFSDGTTVVGVADLASGMASIALGSTALPAGSHAIRAVYSGDGNFAGSDSTVAVTVLAPSTIQGLVYVDLDNNGQVDLGERAVPGVTVTLTGIDDVGHAVNRTAQTDINGVYFFLNLRPSNAAGYTVTETQPADLLDGRDTLGTVNGVLTGSSAVNDAFSAITLPQGGSLAENYNFGERPLTTGGVVPGQTATIGYWQNRNGQNLLRSLNGGPTATQLGHWLAINFPNMYAALNGMTNADVASYYKGLFARTSQTALGGPPKVDCQVLATALAVYVTNQSLAGTMAAAYGFQVSATGLGTRTVNVGSSGAAFGVANNVTVSVMDLLLAVNARSRNGLLYDLNGDGRIDGAEVSYRTMANDVFTATNEAGDI
jgi:hypothetical protein